MTEHTKLVTFIDFVRGRARKAAAPDTEAREHRELEALVQAFWRGDFDGAAHLWLQGHPSPVTREFLLNVLTKGDPWIPSIIRDGARGLGAFYALAQMRLRDWPETWRISYLEQLGCDHKSLRELVRRAGLNRGRTPGAGSYVDADRSLLQEMATLIANGRAASVDAAAKMVAEHASGGGSVESKAKRLARRYAARPAP
jgi:hypothetical protein